MTPVSRARQPTPLHARTAELCATNSWIDACGFTIPALYTSPREEHEALTTRVTLSDLSARQCWLIEGADAAAYLSFVTLADAAKIESGQTARTLWCDDHGHVRGEGLIARFAATLFEFSSVVRDFAWLADGARGFDVKITNVTGSRAIVGVRGPRAKNLLAAAGLSGEPANMGDVVRPSWRPAQVALMRDATGEGLELWMQADDGAVVWDRLWRSGAGLGVAAAGADTLETVRIESAVPRPGIDWQPAHLIHHVSELRLPADLGFTPDLSRRFNGADALRRARPGRAPVLVQLASDEALAQGPLTAKGASVGQITSAAWSESRACGIALAWIEPDGATTGAKVTAVGLRGSVVAEVTRPVFAREQ
jgi:aminomethyltransferase